MGNYLAGVNVRINVRKMVTKKMPITKARTLMTLCRGGAWFLYHVAKVGDSVLPFIEGSIDDPNVRFNTLSWSSLLFFCSSCIHTTPHHTTQQSVG